MMDYYKFCGFSNVGSNMGNKKFEILLMKNTLAIGLPAVAVLVVLVFMFLHYPVFEQIKCVNIDDTDNVMERMADLYNAGTTNVEYTAHNLYYTGFDYYVDGKIKGAYYYSMEKNCLQMYLLKTDKPKSSYDELRVKGKIIKDTISMEHIINQFTRQNGFSDELLEGYCNEYVLSETDYPYAYIAMVYVFFFLPVIVCVLILIYAFLVWWNPSMHSQARQLAVYGMPAAVIKELSSQLRYHLIFRKNNIYITSDYMIVSYLTKTDVIKLEYIKSLTKNEIDRVSFGNRTSKIYRLTMSAPEVLFYEVDFGSEGLIDDVIEYICGINDEVKYN
jgi:hypothetical protein